MSKDSKETEVEVNEVPNSAEEIEANTEEKPKIYSITKEEIEQLLINNGFTKIETDHYKKIEEAVKKRMIINGQEVSKKEEVHIDVELVGEGFIEDDSKFLMTQGVSLKVGGDAVSDFWVSCKEDLSFYMNLK